MILNLILLFAVFGAKRKTKNPYTAALLLGVIKTGVCVLFSRNILFSIFAGGEFAALAAAFVYFLNRLDKPKANEETKTPSYRSAEDKMELKWEYIPLTILLLFMLFA